jgi:hypothetical protein
MGRLGAQGTQHPSNVLDAVKRRFVAGKEGKEEEFEWGQGRRNRKIIFQNHHSQRLCFNLNMHQKAFGDRALPGPAVVSLSAPTELLAAMGDQGREHPSDPLPQLGGRDEEWRRGGMERWAGREGTGNLLKLIIDIDLIFTSKYTKTFGGRASPRPVGCLRTTPRLLGRNVWPGKGMPPQTA